MTTVPFPPTPPDDLADRLSVTVDEGAASGDLLPVLARLLIDMATKRNGPPSTDGPLHVFSTPPVSEAEGVTDVLYANPSE